MATARLSVERALGAIADRGERAAGAVAAALTAAAAASLVELTAALATARLRDGDGGRDEAATRLDSLASRSRSLRERLLEVADEDAAAWARVADASGDAERARALASAADPPLEIAEAAAELAAGAARVRAAGEWPFSPDATAAAELALAAAEVASGLVAANLAGHPDDPRRERGRAAAARARRERDAAR